jgi:hypothetical protein
MKDKRRLARRQSSRKRAHDLVGADLAVASPGIGEKPPKARASHVHHLRHRWEAKRGQKPAFTPARQQDLQHLLEDELRKKPKRPYLDEAVDLIVDQLLENEKAAVKDSTIKTWIARPVYTRLKKRQ